MSETKLDPKKLRETASRYEDGAMWSPEMKLGAAALRDACLRKAEEIEAQEKAGELAPCPMNGCGRKPNWSAEIRSGASKFGYYFCNHPGVGTVYGATRKEPEARAAWNAAFGAKPAPEPLPELPTMEDWRSWYGMPGPWGHDRTIADKRMDALVSAVIAGRVQIVPVAERGGKS